MQCLCVVGGGFRGNGEEVVLISSLFSRTLTFERVKRLSPLPVVHKTFPYYLHTIDKIETGHAHLNKCVMCLRRGSVGCCPLKNSHELVLEVPCVTWTSCRGITEED